MFSGSKRLLAVADGNALPLDAVSNEGYSSKSLGDGFAVEPLSGTVYSPVSGKIGGIGENRREYVINSHDGLEIKIKIGLDTLCVDGHSFISLVEEGDIVRAGDIIAKADIGLIKSLGLSATMPVLISNSENLKLCDFKAGFVRGGKSTVMTYRK